MLGSLLRTLGLGGPDDGPVGTETVSAIAQAIDGLDPDRARFIAGFAYLLSRVAFADHDVSEGERQTMETQLVELGGLSPEQAAGAVALAVEATGRHGATEDYQVVREFRALASDEEKLRLLRCLFTISAYQGITASEDNEISRIAASLRIEQRQVAALRAEYRDRLNSIRAGRGSRDARDGTGEDTPGGEEPGR